MAEAHATYPAMPEIGHPESYYAKIAKTAQKLGDEPLHESAKVGQYVTLAMDPQLSWEQKVRYFRHALNRHCVPPRFSSDDCWKFYRDLADVVREHAGREALRLASAEDDFYAKRQALGQDPEKIAAEAEAFFQSLMGAFVDCPEWFSHEDWEQLKLLRDQWV